VKLFVAVATGQNVANLPPMLQFAGRGDHVLWLESELAARQKWADGAIAVLEGREIHSHRAAIPGDINEPLAVEKALSGWLADHGGDFAELNIVLNGGQKLTPFGLALAARPWREQLGKPVRFLYGDDRPAQVQLREQHVGARVQTLAYDAARMLSLEEVVRVAGREMESVSEPLDWRDPPAPDPYGSDAAFTALVHASAKGQDTEHAGLDWPGFDSWSKGSKRLFNERITPILDALAGHSLSREAKFEAYPRLVRMIRQFEPRQPSPSPSKEDRARLREQGWWTENGRQNVGARFERAVADRIRRFLAERPGLAEVIREVRLNAKVPGAEWDVVLVLVNGILLHLECKSWRVKKKDMDARMHVIQSASSRLARTFLVVPMFPEFAGESWFRVMHENFSRMLDIGIPVLAYTMEGSNPASEYRVPGLRGEFRWPEPFEQSLEKLLRPYAG